MKKVLAIHFSQSGQLTEIMTNFCNSLKDVEVEYQKIVPSNPFPFPWTTYVFFDQMPETVLEKPIEIEPIHFKQEKYDLIVFGYQPWYLSPSMPATALLHGEKFKKLLKNTDVITLIGSRNMWLNAQESIKKYMLEAGGNLRGNIALADRSHNLVGVITILHWMLTGQKTKKWGFFPTPGVSDEDIAHARVFGKLASTHLQTNSWDGYQEKVIKNEGAVVPTNILFIEERAKRLFVIWANIITKKATQGKRKTWVASFKYYLIFVLFIVSPVLLLFYRLLFYPFLIRKVNKRKAYFQSVLLNQ